MAPQAHGQTAGLSQDSTNDLAVSVGKSALVDFDKQVTRVAIGSSDVAEATAVSPTEVMVNGKAAGDTTLIVWEQGGGRQFFNVSVHPSRFAAEDRVTDLRRELRAALPGQNINVTAVNNLVFLRGTVKDMTSSDRAVEIAATAGKVVNLLYVEVPSTPRQILLKVRFASIDRSLVNQLGVNVFSTGAANTIGTVSTGQFSPPTVTMPTASTGAVATVSQALNLFFFRPDLNLGATIQALENKGVVQVLAQPNVLTENGKQGSFLAGGEYPYPIVQGIAGGVGGAVTIEFKEYGVRLNFIPTIMPDGNIRLQVAPEVSSLDFTNAVTISGFTIPAITVRRVNTEVELAPGQSFAIGGLLDNRETSTFEKMPFIGDIPVLGKFFQSVSKNRTNTELIVFITPEIVDPIKAGEPLPGLSYPDKFLPPNSKIAMHQPDGTTESQNTTVPASTAASAAALPATAVPVEQLKESMKPETPLVTEGSYTVGVAGGSGASTGASSSSMPQ
ncbi:type II and III secretion system protein family protein [Edaphobacter acidisoli]|uniref:type II and III secretion system protein family protein n=1 Tax=Edaphobacter acidisoli TaxID=2040573 RepID=UPI001E5BAE7D|nr:pilus assembly protein N-terminal domain-containing protein [Edaphobacter acidisoli]